MTEATLKSTLVTKLRSSLDGFVILRHEDRFTGGIPDMSVSGMGRTSWYEVKFANPTFERKGVQDLTLQRMAKAGLAHYIIFHIVGNNLRYTRLVRPDEIDDWMVSSKFIAGFNYEWLSQQILAIHQMHAPIFLE